MAGRRREYRTAVKDLPNRQPTIKYSCCNEFSCRSGKERRNTSRPGEELVDSYEIDARAFTEAASNKLERLVETVQGIGPRRTGNKRKNRFDLETG